MTGLLNQAKKRYGAKMGSENKLGNSENAIFEITIGNQPAILRLSRYTEQKKRHVDFELTWLKYLAGHLSYVAAPVLSQKGHLYEVIEGDDGCWIVCAFQKAPGHIVDITNPLVWNERLFQSIGKLMGKLHACTKPYAQEKGIDERLDWRHSFLFWPENNQWLDPDIQPIWHSTLREMEALPITQADYGIVHTDIHHQNFHVWEGKISLFDFDDCEYNWYAYDIASTLFFMAGTADFNDPGSGSAMLSRFGAPFLAGYRKQTDLPPHWLNMIPLFLRYRRLAQYKYFSNLFHGQPNPHDKYLSWAKQDILNGFSYLQFDFFTLV